MTTQQIDIKKLKLNPNNPRVIKDYKFKKLVKSIQEFPQMLEIRPIIVNDDMVIIGGNMRYRAAIELGYKKVPVSKVVGLTEEQQKEFTIKDNLSYGEWDYDILANEWDAEKLDDWGADMPEIKIEDINDSEDDNERSPKATDDGYSTFELIMLHENKLLLLDTINKVKQNFLFEKIEDALMEIIRVYNKQ
jgi:arsenate reductase-like glutaredoxin family protein